MNHWKQPNDPPSPQQRLLIFSFEDKIVIFIIVMNSFFISKPCLFQGNQILGIHFLYFSMFGNHPES
jgi:hypothetical protein